MEGTSASPSVRVEKAGRVTTIILSRPEVRNAVDPETGRKLVDAFTAFEHDADADVAVFWGAHGAFSAGGDLKHLSATGADAWLNALKYPRLGYGETPPGPLGPSRLELSKPVIAAVTGAAVAGGMELALWCDMRIMEESAYFGVYCRRWGVPLIDGGTVRLPRIVGMGRAMDIILTGRKVPAEEAHRIGLCERVVKDGSARQEAEALAQELTRFPQECLRADRASAYRQHGLSVRDAMRQEYQGGLEALRREGISGATRFAEGKGRHGDYGEI
jgi:enoyl-CoA hydratase/carnithine racemase